MVHCCAVMENDPWSSWKVMEFFFRKKCANPGNQSALTVVNPSPSVELSREHFSVIAVCNLKRETCQCDVSFT